MMLESDWVGWSGLTGASLLTEAFHAQEFTAHHISIHTVYFLLLVGASTLAL